MIKSVKLYSILALAALMLVVASCRKDKRTGWNTQLLVPIASSTLSLTNLIKDSASVKVNSDSSLTLAYQSSLYSFNLANQIIQIPDTSIGQKFTLDSLTLPNQYFTYRTSLGYLAITMLDSPGTAAIGNLILLENGSTANVPGLNGFSPGDFVFSAADYFDSAILVHGEINVWVVNNLPVALNGGTAYVKNGDGTSVAGPVSLPHVNAHDSAYLHINVDNIRITSQLVFSVTNLSTAPSNGPVPIDTSNSITLKMFITNMHVSEAWAKFPAQNVVGVTEDVTVPIGDRKFTYIDARSGHLGIHIFNSVPQPLYLEYTLVGAYDNRDRPLVEYTTVPAAPPGGRSTVDTTLDIAGYSINLTGKDGNSFNTYTQRVVARIDSTGITQHITLADSLNIRYDLQGIAPNYIKGYAGRDTISTIDSSSFNFLSVFKSGSIDLKEVNMKFSVANGLGVNGQVVINRLTALNSTNGQQKTLTGSVVGQPFNIARATDFPLTPSINNFNINSNNSNIKDLLGILPDKLLYDVQVKTNINGNDQQYRDFAYLQSNLDINLNAEVPLSLIASHLLLRDTINFNLANSSTNVAGISDGVINVITENKYPIEPILTMVIYDENWNAVDTLLSNQVVNAGLLDNYCKVNAPARTVVPVYVNQDRMTRIKTGRYAVITADFSTASNNANCNGQHLTIYSSYNLGITLSAKFNYKISAQF
ncbi:MAG TPA: hypothetical protein VG603_15265 [Chitinophagales bacterium]|nr:hypothetical protein [Chitinophagales bacterium]